jgi:hypothetical protein
MENLQALHNFDSIAVAADAITLSRGNLGLDVAPEKTAVVQKAAINRCNLLGKPVIITRVMDTMAEAPRCTRCGHPSCDYLNCSWASQFLHDLLHHAVGGPATRVGSERASALPCLARKAQENPH